MADQQRIADIAARCEAATPGPWESANKSVRVTGSQQEAPWGKYAPCGYEGGICNCLGKSSYQSSAKDQVNVQAKANSAFIAHARGDLPWAVDTIKALEAQLAAKNAEIERLRERETYPCYDYECYERGNYHAGCGACPYFKHPLPAEPEEGAEK